MANDQDVMMNGFPESNDGKYIYAETSDGKQIKISKADLASIVAQQIGVATTEKNGLVDRRLVGIKTTVGNDAKSFSLKTTETWASASWYCVCSSCEFILRAAFGNVGVALSVEVDVLSKSNAVTDVYFCGTDNTIRVDLSTASTIRVIPIDGSRTNIDTTVSFSTSSSGGTKTVQGTINMLNFGANTPAQLASVVAEETIKYPNALRIIGTGAQVRYNVAIGSVYNYNSLFLSIGTQNATRQAWSGFVFFNNQNGTVYYSAVRVGGTADISSFSPLFKVVDRNIFFSIITFNYYHANILPISCSGDMTSISDQSGYAEGVQYNF